ncbi:MAG: hypothetical protein NTX91_00960 [candidate division SR1 bacterium]|nr:hypothetical protein [candidate division SR1 bacterium]
MNTIQQTIMLILAAQHYEVFEDGFENNERQFIYKLGLSYYLDNLRVHRLVNKQFALIWKTRSETKLDIYVGCSISHEGIDFSDLKLYNETRNCLESTLNHLPMGLKFEAWEEADEIKDLFLSYSTHNVNYFK